MGLSVDEKNAMINFLNRINPESDYLNQFKLKVSTFYRSNIDGKEYMHYHCEGHGDKLEGVSPLPYGDLKWVTPPLGQGQPRHEKKDFFIGRILSYIPVCGIFVGSEYIGTAAYAIYRYVIRNNGPLCQYSYHQDDKAQVYVLIQKEHEVALDGCQRLAVLGQSIALMVRGIFSILGVGIILLPLDYLYDRLSQPRDELLEVENKIQLDFSSVQISKPQEAF